MRLPSVGAVTCGSASSACLVILALLILVQIVACNLERSASYLEEYGTTSMCVTGSAQT